MYTKIIDDVNNPLIQEINELLISWINVDNLKVIQDGIKNNTYPITIALLENAKLIGFYQIVEHDNDYTNYTPWIANVFIKEEYRGQGYGRKLIETIPSYMDKLGINTIYLHTRLNNLYEKFGWERLKPLNLNDDIKRYIYIRKK